LSTFRHRRPPDLTRLLDEAVEGVDKPIAIVLAGHNGSGKSTLWKQRLAPRLQIPLVNADRLTASILPERDPKTGQIPKWAQQLRDDDERWQRLSQDAVKAISHLVMANRMPFATETVFSHWRPRGDGTFESKADLILELQKAGYYVALIFVGLATPDISALRVRQRWQQGGHNVPSEKIEQRFPRTQKAIGYAAPLADITLMFDNSLDERHAFSLARVQKGARILFDCRDTQYVVGRGLRNVSSKWLTNVVGHWIAR
jgi:predicted ABC-type ATPase